MPEADKDKIVKAIHELEVTFDFPDIELKDIETELTPDGKVIFEPVMSIKYWLQKDGSISKDYPLSVHHRLNAAFTNAGFKIIEASAKGVKVESISKYELQDNTEQEKWRFSENACQSLHDKIIDNLKHQVSLYRKLKENKAEITENFVELNRQGKIVDKALEDLKDSFADEMWKKTKGKFTKVNHKQSPLKPSKKGGLMKLSTDDVAGKILMNIINFFDTIVDGAVVVKEINELGNLIDEAIPFHESYVTYRQGLWEELERTNAGLNETH